MPGQERKWHLYILRCRDESLYTGITTDPERRLNEHNSGRGAKYTRSRKPCVRVALWDVPDKSTALRLEYAVKRLSRKQKLVLIRSPDLISLVLDKPQHIVPVDIPDGYLLACLDVAPGSDLDG